MDFSCGECFEIWNCSWCNNQYCDDICCPYKLEGKPIYWNKNDVDKNWWNSLTEKEKIKKEKLLSSEPPIIQNFFLCEECKNKYIEKNICKGRHVNKIGQKEHNF